MVKNIIVISHQRSGTHLTIDTIRNNFPLYKKKNYVVLNRKFEKDNEQIQFLKNFKEKTTVVKTHFLPNFETYTNNNLHKQKLNDLFNNSHLIYVYRNGLDVMVSLYLYMQKYDNKVKNISFEKFLQTENNFDDTKEKYSRIQFWGHHIKTWKESQFAKNILWIKYEDLNNNYEETITKIAEHFNIEQSKKHIDIRLKSYRTKNRRVRKLINFFKKIKTTSVSARKGGTGDYKNYFNEKTIKLFINENKEIFNNLNYKT